MLGALGRHDEARILWDACLARWPDVEALAGEAIADAANAEDWDRLENLAEAAFRRGLNSPRLQAFTQAQRDRRTLRPDILDAHRQQVAASFARDGRASLADLAKLVALSAADEAFDYAERASFAHMFEPGAPLQAGAWAPAVIFVAANRRMIADRRFVPLCARMGLVDYWTRSGHWPDCADDAALGYDFRAECRAVAAH